MMVKDVLSIAVCQCGVAWEAPEENFARIGEMIRRYTGQCPAWAEYPDIIVLPEFFSTGFTSNTALAEPVDGPSLDWMRRTASGFGTALAGSVPVLDGGMVYNRFYFVRPDGRTEWYDKRHLFRMSGENEVFASGCRRRVVEYLGWRIGLNVCYDLRFPVWSRRTPDNDYEVMLNVASWPSSRAAAASILAYARAVENQSWFIFCNRVGESPENRYAGGSLIVDYKGRCTGNFHTDVSVDEDGAGFLSTCLERDGLLRFREKFPAWMDADEFEMNL